MSRWSAWSTWSSWSGHLPRDVGVIVVAAGRSTRLGGGAAKQYRPVAGVPLVLRAVRPFAAHPEVAHLVLCNLFRHPVITAQSLASLDQLSGGRLVAGLGTGWTEICAYGTAVRARKL